MRWEHYRFVGEKKLRCGFTTGTCAAMGAKACALALLKGEKADSVRVTVPKGLQVLAEVDVVLGQEKAMCRVVKDGGDDVDVTHGAVVVTELWLSPGGVCIEGGHGVGRVTKPGLDQAVGQAAINSVPRRMIEAELLAVARQTGYEGGFSVVVSVENGEELAKKTFNPNLGIVGGVSVLGTSGIVEPMSVKALKQSIEAELNVQVAAGAKTILLTPGNYGEDYIQKHEVLCGMPAVKCSNFIGDTLDMAARKDIENVLLVGHFGKLVKLAGGIMNTHSKMADARLEIITAHAAMAGISNATAKELMQCVSVDSALDILKRENIYKPVVASLLCKIQRHLKAHSSLRVGAITFSHVHGHIGTTETAYEILGNGADK